MKKDLIRRSTMSTLITLLFPVVLFVFTFMTARDVSAHANGINGYSGNPATNSGSICTLCHSGGTTPTVTLTGPTSLTTGTTGVYTLTITGGAAVFGGLDVSATAGTLLATGANTQIMSGEVTQTGATSFSGSSLSFTFSLVAPASAGTLTLYGAGLSANGDRTNSGDYANKTSLTVNVTAAAAPQIAITDPIPPANDLQIPFGTIYDNLASDQTVTISNAGTADLNITSIASANPLAAPFSIPTDNCSGKTIAPAGSCTLIVRFAPTSSGTFTDAFDIQSNDSTSPATVNVSGTGMTPPSTAQIVISNLNILFGSVNDGLASDQTVTISNGGNADLAIYQIAYANPLAAPFTILADNCSGKTIASGGNCSLTVHFAPTSSGTFSDSFDVPSNDPATPATVSVSGTGNAPPTAPTLVSPADGQTVTGTTATLVWNKSTDPDNDPITYDVYNCLDSTASCTPVNVASSGMVSIYLAGSGLFFVGFVVARGGRSRKLMLMLMIGMLLMSSAVLISCGSKSNGPSAPTTVSYQASSLTPSTTYYWKVIAVDSQGNRTPSPTIWSYTTTQ